MKFRHAFLRVVPNASIIAKIIDRTRIGITLIEALDFF
jgi:hypothetical protein